MKKLYNSNIGIIFIILFLLAAPFCFPGTSTAYETVLKIGVFADEGNDLAHKHWDATADSLTAAIAGYKFTIVPLMLNEFRTSLDSGGIAFLICDPQIFAEAQAEFGATCLATLKTEFGGKITSNCASVIFASSKSGIKSFQDLKNKKFIASHPTSLAGWSAAMRELKNDSINPETDFASFSFTGASELTVFAVLNEICDAGSVKNGVLEKLIDEGKIKISDIRIVKPSSFKENADFAYMHSTRLYPQSAFARLPSTDKALSKKVADALFQISPSGEAAKAAKIYGWGEPADYGPIIELLREMEIGYFAMEKSFSPVKIIKKHIYEALALIGLIAFLFISLAYVIRNNRIITEARKTIEKELEERKKIEAERQLKREFQSIISEALQLFFVFNDFNDCFQMIFERVSARLKLQRVLIFKDISPGAAKIIHNFNSKALPLKSDTFIYADTPSWKKCLVEEVMINHPQNASLRDDIKTYIQSLGASQLLSLPLYVNNTYSGFIIFACEKEEPMWDEYVISLLFPLTNVISATLEKKQNIEDLQRLIGTKDKFLAILAHDLKSPMASFSLLIDMLRSGMLSDEKKNFTLTGIKDSISNVIKLIDSVVMWAKMQSGAITADRENLSVNSIIEPNIELLSAVSINKNITIDFTKCLLGVFADRSMMLTVVRNLINNAIKFTPPGGKIKISAGQEEKLVRITVEDNGVGMSKAIIDRLFKIGEKIVSCGTAGERGSGFGLILSRDFVTKNGGEILVESEEGKGSKFVFTLPSSQKAIPDDKS